MSSYQSLLESCDRTRSNEAREALRRLLWNAAEARNLALPRDCPLAPAADVLQWQEATKRPISASHWRCGLCGKNFRSEHFLDKHLARKHAAAGPGEASIGAEVEKVCLADFCGASVPCLPLGKEYIPSVSTVLVRREDSEHEHKDGQRQGMTFGERSSPAPRVCRDHVEKRAVMHSCVAVVDRCVPLDGTRPEAEVAQFRYYLVGALCDDAFEVECATWPDKLARRAHLLSKNSISTRHTLGWIALLLTVVVYVMGRYMSRLRRGEDDFARPRRRVLNELMRRKQADKEE